MTRRRIAALALVALLVIWLASRIDAGSSWILAVREWWE